jgi:hypothetical protein
MAATGVTINSATSITATTPAGSAGTASVLVTTSGGTNAANALYTYVEQAPTVTSISPTSGPTTGATSVTITGTNFTGATGVTIGGVTATGVTVNSATSITATTPAGSAGAASVLVTTPSGTNQANTLYTYVALAPTLASIAPASGTTAGGTLVTITGSNLAGATGVSIGGLAATGLTVVNASTLTAITPAHAAGSVDVVVTTPGGNVTGLYSYAVQSTTTTVTSSKNPSEVGQAVTFTASVSAGGATPTGAVTFNDGGVAIGQATLASGTASFTTSALKLGSHSITAVYAGNAGSASSTSSALMQSVSTPQDSVKLRAMQIAGTRAVAQTSGAAITSSIDTAISDGFSNGGNAIVPSAFGIRFNFGAELDQSSATTPDTTSIDRASGAVGAAGNGPSRTTRGGRRDTDAFAALDRNANPVKAARRPAESRDWLFWTDIRGGGISRWSSSNSASALYGDQVNALMGLTRVLTPNFLVGVVGGYEIFDYRSDTLNGRLKGDGWTIGSYAGWKFAQGLRFDAASAYSRIGYNGSAGTAFGDFNGNRWLVSGGLTGNTSFEGWTIEPSAKLYALWETENAYLDSLGTLQADRTFFTGRASGGAKLAYPWLYSTTLTLAPYAGAYADYYFTGDNSATAASSAVASATLLDGWSARVTGGLAARFGSGVSVAVGAELGGLGGNARTWTLSGRAMIPF